MTKPLWAFAQGLVVDSASVSHPLQASCPSKLKGPLQWSVSS